MQKHNGRLLASIALLVPLLSFAQSEQSVSSTIAGTRAAIEQGREQQRLTGSDAAELHYALQRVADEERRMRRKFGGHLSEDDHRKLLEKLRAVQTSISVRAKRNPAS